MKKPLIFLAVLLSIVYASGAFAGAYKCDVYTQWSIIDHGHFRGYYRYENKVRSFKKNFKSYYMAAFLPLKNGHLAVCTPAFQVCSRVNGLESCE